jgi:serine/threonine protein kinase
MTTASSSAGDSGIVEPNFGSKYELVDRLAKGGMAEIFLAQSKGAAGFEKQVVIKRVLPELGEDSTFVEMFLQEARLGARLSHPNIVQIFDFGQVDGCYFIAMEFVDGRSLIDMVVKARRSGVELPIPVLVKIISNVAEGLHYAHSAVDNRGQPLNVVHRDISPSNILVSFGGAVKITDFGIAKASLAVHQTRSGVIKGKYSYMSPQQCMGEPVDHRADLFSLGVVLFEISTCRRLFARKNEALTIHTLLHEPIPRPSAVVDDYPEILEQIVMHCLARDPQDRYQDSRSLHQDLERYLADAGNTVSAMDIADLMKKVYPAEVRESLPQPITLSDSFVDVLAPSISSASQARHRQSAEKPNKEIWIMLALLLLGSAMIWIVILFAM